MCAITDATLVQEGDKVEDDYEEVDSCQSEDMYDMSESSEEEEDPLSDPSQVQPFNIELLATLVEGTSPTLQHLKDKNVGILLGKTGTGKSTLMHAIAGTIDFTL